MGRCPFALSMNKAVLITSFVMEIYRYNVLPSFGLAKTGRKARIPFSSWKAASHSIVHLKFFPFQSNTPKGRDFCATLGKNDLRPRFSQLIVVPR